VTRNPSRSIASLPRTWRTTCFDSSSPKTFAVLQHISIWILAQRAPWPLLRRESPVH